MKTKLTKASAAIAALGMALSFPAAVLAGPQDHELPDENDLFWRVTASMSRPDDKAGCQAAINAISTEDLVAYAIAHPHGDGGPQGGSEAEQAAGIRQGFSQMCTMIAQMPTQMQADMASETDGAVTTNLFGMSDWHHVTGLYFQKAGKGRISFTNTLDFLSYRFFRFMNNFGSLVEMNDGYISFNAAMMDDIRTYGAQLTMYGLNLGSAVPDIYVDGRLASANDVSNVTYNAGEGSLTFTAKHFSSYRAVAHGSKVKTMVISKVTKKSVKYSARKSSFQVKVKGKNLKPATRNNITCTLGFEKATKVRYTPNGKHVTCTFPMSYFSSKGTFPITISIPGTGEVTKLNAFRVR